MPPAQVTQVAINWPEGVNLLAVALSFYVFLHGLKMLMYILSGGSDD